MLDKLLDNKKIESEVSGIWAAQDAFAYKFDCNKPSYTITLPPPNVTGSLHLGHALCFILQDILIRYKRMSGFNVLWQPGLDHGGIVTQLLVTKELELGGVDVKKVTREELIEKIWNWKNRSGSTILSQMHKLGCSIDLSMLRFTMDEQNNEAVIKTFVRLYDDCLIYKDTRLVNWDPKLESAISDLEVSEKEQDGKMYYIKYNISGGSKYITVATTRPETLFGDTAVAVNTADERYFSLRGGSVVVPICGRVIPVVFDDYCDMEKGTGAVKITPAHDFNDFEVGKRHNLEQINILDKKACLNERVPADFVGLDRYEARSKVIAILQEQGLLERVEDITHTVPYADRSGVVIEPYLTEQWFLDAQKLAVRALNVVQSGEVSFVPKSWENTYFEWMNNIKPWCISRQITWGHQIPAWYGPDNKIFVCHDEAEAIAKAEKHYGYTVQLQRDCDVLDTWYSSSLWPFSTLNWGSSTEMMARHYPNNVLMTGFDIIFFWVARMMMMGLYFTGQPPFHEIYIHALVRDEKGQKMSKSKGNVIDPITLIDEFGCDALRFSMAAFASPGRDICIFKERISGYRSFLTKLWNAVRFAQMNDCFSSNKMNLAVKMPINRWILSKLNVLIASIEVSINSYRFDNYANALYQFLWLDFCDWYVEFSKPFLTGDYDSEKSEVQSTIRYVVASFLKLLSPIAPFISEHIYTDCFNDDSLIMSLSLPQCIDVCYAEDVAMVSFVQDIISEIRSVRKEINIPPAMKIDCCISSKISEELSILIERMGRVRIINNFETELKVVVHDVTVGLCGGDFDFVSQKARLSKELVAINEKIESITKRLANAAFLEKASPQVVLDTRKLLEDNIARFKKIKNIID